VGAQEPGRRKASTESTEFRETRRLKKEAEPQALYLSNPPCEFFSFLENSGTRRQMRAPVLICFGVSSLMMTTASSTKTG
jgi:hypothetical protein